MNSDFSHAKACAEHYRKLGLCPLPSRMDTKAPLLPSYTEHYAGKPVPSWVYAKWNTTNIQVITGVNSPTPTKIIVVDLDGPEAIDAWGRIAYANGYGANTGWRAMTGSGGRHHWFLLPDDVKECPSGIIWGLWDSFGDSGKGAWAKHKEVRILADNSLVVAPPSIHVTTGRSYEFSPNANPKVNRLPDIAPGWLIQMPRLTSPRFIGPPIPRKPLTHVRKPNKYHTRQEVISAVGGNKFDIAVNEWGLIPGRSMLPNGNGWCTCFVPGREDPRFSNPSGSFNFTDGTLQDRKDLSSISFFDLGVVLGVFSTWQDCRNHLADRYLGQCEDEPVSFKYPAY